LNKDHLPFHVAIIGAGVVGSAIARELSKYDINVVLLDANSDVDIGTSKASTAIWHTRYDAPPGSLEGPVVRKCLMVSEQDRGPV